MHTPSPLPNDVEALKQLVVDRDGLIAKLLAEIAQRLPSATIATDVGSTKRGIVEQAFHRRRNLRHR